MATAPTATVRASTPVGWILGLLDAVGSQPAGGSLRQCPNPDHGGDSHPSLSVTARDGGGVKLHCFAGCPERDILAALGLGLRQLYQPPAVSPRRYAETARLQLWFPPLAARHGHPAARGYRLESVHVFGPAGGGGHVTGGHITGHRLLRWRLPTSGAKELEWETTLASGLTAPGLMGTALHALPLYLEQDVRAATALHHLPGHTHQRVLVVESESTVDSLHAWNAKLWASGAPDDLTNWCATTWAGGAPAVNTDRLARILGDHPHTVLMPDADPPGLACLHTMLAAGLGPAVLLGAPGEDARDLYRRLGPLRFARAVDHALATAGTSREPVVTVATDQLVNLPAAGLERLLAAGGPASGHLVPSTAATRAPGLLTPAVRRPSPGGTPPDPRRTPPRRREGAPPVRSQIPVDIFTHPGATIDAAAALDLAEGHGMRDLMARLLPYAVTGPTFVPDIHQHLTDALASLRAGSGEDAEHHLEEATQCEPQSWKAVHQPGTRPDTPDAVRAPGGLVNVHTYPPKSAATLATSYVFQSRDHATAGDVPYFLGGGNGVARSTWRQRLRRAATRSVAVVAIGGSHRRVDDQRWRTVAADAATTVDKFAPWIAVRRPQPDGVLVFIATARAVTPAIRRRIAAIATSHLLPAPRPGTPFPHTATTATTPPRSHQNPPAGVPHR